MMGQSLEVGSWAGVAEQAKKSEKTGRQQGLARQPIAVFQIPIIEASFKPL